MINKISAKLNRKKALLRLGLAATTLYMAPVLVLLKPASASGAIAPARDALTVQECSECHMAFNPRYLRAYSWRKLMANLENHFGEDASIDEETRLKIEKYLVYNAGRPRNILIRITDLKWFKRRHSSQKISGKLIKRAGTLSNCVSCHGIRK